MANRLELMDKRGFSKKIIGWYWANLRDLPWRNTQDPYRIWLSEVILQQTRVAQGLPYYHEFVRLFPNIRSLASASEDQVMRAWQGLGYYSRARHLHACAKLVVARYNGKFPRESHALRVLPGIGVYTAAAIASMAFGQPEAVVDGNVYRVLARIFGMDDDISAPAGKKAFEKKAKELLDTGQPGIYNQAIMEFGALQCTPKSPGCATCIFSSACHARAKNLQHALPVKGKRAKVRTRYFTYLIPAKGKKLAMKKRGVKDIWAGLYDFYVVEGKRPQRPETIIKNDKGLAPILPYLNIEMKGGLYKHVLTHQHIFARFVLLSLPRTFPAKKVAAGLGARFYSPAEIALLPKPALVSRFFKQSGLLE